MIDRGDTAWLLIATALVLFMTPGLAFFYAGMVRSKNVLGMLMQNFFAMGLLAVLWVVIGFSLAFGNFGDGGWIGNLDYFGMANVGQTATTLGAGGWMADGKGMTLTIPFLLFAAFQMTFAIITPALITGATADRFKFKAYVVFIGAWLILVYAPVAHWVFGGGWLAKLGALDFAGGAVVHINAGAASLAIVLVLGKRLGWPKEQMHPHSLPWTLIGAGILWFGWAGFNAGSALAADGIAVQALYNTFVAASAGMLGWLLVERMKDGKPTTLGAASGAVAGLVAITPNAGYVGGMAPVFIGLAAGIVCFLAIQLKFRFGYDDSLDVVGVHLVGGLLGSLLLGVFASKVYNPAGADGLIEGDLTLLKNQAIASISVLVFSFVVSLIIAKVIDLLMHARVDETDEEIGLDLSQHAEAAYSD
ncbi:MAG: ammonium transporter [Actinobacteria bacterium]|nr:ammonium transporter [Actinomycetota bacterium]